MSYDLRRVHEYQFIPEAPRPLDGFGDIMSRGCFIMGVLLLYPPEKSMVPFRVTQDLGSSSESHPLLSLIFFQFKNLHF